MADEYRLDEFLDLDLSKPMMSPKPISPPAHFAGGARRKQRSKKRSQRSRHGARRTKD